MERQIYGSLGHEHYVGYCRHIRASGEDLLRTIDGLLVHADRANAGAESPAPAAFMLAPSVHSGTGGLSASSPVKGLA
jgi:hypothetical protein